MTPWGSLLPWRLPGVGSGPNPQIHLVGANVIARKRYKNSGARASILCIMEGRRRELKPRRKIMAPWSGNGYHCDECGSGDDGSIESKIYSELETLISRFVSIKIPEYVVELEATILWLNLELKEAKRPDSELQARLGEMSLYASNMDVVKIENSELRDELEKQGRLNDEMNNKILELHGHLSSAANRHVELNSSLYQQIKALKDESSGLRIALDGRRKLSDGYKEEIKALKDQLAKRIYHKTYDVEYKV